jgi:hypothetical protein
VARHEACLVDVYDTLLSCDFIALRTRAAEAGTTVVRSLPEVETLLRAG